ncbi:glycosyltransferase 61 family protein [Hyphococcus luteus]|nr:glycosyltransferase 61 family protein [Marinicaulis flavus]
MNPMIRLRPYTNAAMKRLRRPPAFVESATQSIILEPEMKMTHRPPLLINGEMDRVTGFSPGDTFDRAKALIFGGEVTKAPLIRYEFKNILVYPTGLSTEAANYMRSLSLPHRELMSGKLTRLPKALSTHTSVSVRYFGHWLGDSCPTALLKEEDEALLMTNKDEWPHTAEYSHLFGLTPEAPGVYHVETLSWVHDIGQGENRARRCRELRRRLRAHDDLKEEKAGGGLVYLRRGLSGVRREIAHEDELIARLAAKGFKILDITGLSARDLLRQALDAEICVTIDGSHMDHAHYFLKEHGLLLVIQPSDRFCLAPLERADAFGLNTAFIVADASPDGYVVDADKILRTIDLWRKQKAATA